MKYLLACRRYERTWYLGNDGLTAHQDQARVFLSRTNAEEAAEKYRKPRGRLDRTRPKLYVSPVREGD